MARLVNAEAVESNATGHRVYVTDIVPDAYDPRYGTAVIDVVPPIDGAYKLVDGLLAGRLVVRRVVDSMLVDHEDQREPGTRVELGVRGCTETAHEADEALGYLAGNVAVHLIANPDQLVQHLAGEDN
jgi:hypothetical protein